MFKRIATGLAYVAVLVGFFFLRWVDHRLFGILVYAFSIIGTYEMVRAFSGKRCTEEGREADAVMAMSLSQKITVYAYAALFTPLFYLVEHFAPGEGYRGMPVLSFLFALILFCLLVFDHRRTNLLGTGAAMISGFYPTAILATMLLANEFRTASTLALQLMFVIPAVADTFAFAVGSVLKGPKLCPNISPKKTVSGAVGGVVFGTAASVLLYFLYAHTTGYVYEGLGSSWAGAPWLMFAVIGAVASLLTEFGDLVESVIKRRLGIKDMGRLLPGHGGILDRIDGTLFASTFIYVVFALLIVHTWL